MATHCRRKKKRRDPDGQEKGARLLGGGKGKKRGGRSVALGKIANSCGKNADVAPDGGGGEGTAGAGVASLEKGGTAAQTCNFLIEPAMGKEKGEGGSSSIFTTGMERRKEALRQKAILKGEGKRGHGRREKTAGLQPGAGEKEKKRR